MVIDVGAVTAVLGLLTTIIVILRTSYNAVRNVEKSYDAMRQRIERLETIEKNRQADSAMILRGLFACMNELKDLHDGKPSGKSTAPIAEVISEFEKYLIEGHKN